MPIDAFATHETAAMSNIPLIIDGEVVHRGAARRQQTLGDDIKRKALRGVGDEDDKRSVGQIASDLIRPYCTARNIAFLVAWYLCMRLMDDLWPIGFMLGFIVAIFLNTRGADEGRQVRVADLATTPVTACIHMVYHCMNFWASCHSILATNADNLAGRAVCLLSVQP
jgi:hypothetical protein